MSRLALVLIAAVLLVLLADRAVEPLLERAAESERSEDPLDPMTRLLDLVFDSRIYVYRTSRRYEALPARKSAAELRVFVIGNSTALSIDPALIQADLARELPGREPSVVTLVLPALRTAESLLLVRAALAKQADVVVTTLSVRGLEAGDSYLGPLLRDRFEVGASARRGLAALPGSLGDRMALLRHAGELRTVAARRVAGLLHGRSRAALRLRAGEDVAAIVRVAKTGDREALWATYESRGWSWLLQQPASTPDLLPPDSPVWSTLDEIAQTVARSGVLGAAIFMPVNPLWRVTEPPRAPWQIDDAWLREVAGRALFSFAQAGWEVCDAVDALPGEAFIDLVHVNGAEHDRSISREVARVVLRRLQREEARLSGERSPGP